MFFPDELSGKKVKLFHRTEYFVLQPAFTESQNTKQTTILE